MKWLVFSDSHGNLEYMKRAVEEYRPDGVLHLGDVSRDAQRLAQLFPGLPVEGVRGNCDGMSGDAPVEREIFIGGKRLWLLHGHTYHVKWGVGMLVSEARARGVDAVLFGHTHQPLCYREGRLWVVNPGTVSGRPRATCSVIEKKGEELDCRTAVLSGGQG